jgi:tetratricopeptide (TPR) repeat protein
MAKTKASQDTLRTFKTVILWVMSGGLFLTAIMGALRVTFLSLEGIPFTTIKEDLQIYKDPNNALAYSNRGWIRAESGDREGAITDFTEAIKIISSEKDKASSRLVGGLYFDRGQVYRHLGSSAESQDPAEARKNYRLAISDYQKSADLCKLADDTSCSTILSEVKWVKESYSKVTDKN